MRRSRQWVPTGLKRQRRATLPAFADLCGSAKIGSALLTLRGNRHWLLQPEFQERLAGHLYLLAAREDLYASACRRTRAGSDRRTTAASRNTSDDGAQDRSATDFLSGVGAAALPFQGVVTADHRIVLPVDDHAGQLQLQLRTPRKMPRLLGLCQVAVDVRALSGHQVSIDVQVCFQAGVKDVADI